MRTLKGLHLNSKMFSKASVLIDQMITFVWPEVKINGTPWKVLWQQQERAQHITTSKLVFGGATIAYLAHFIFIDLPTGKKPIALWAAYRIGLSALLVLGIMALRRAQKSQSSHHVLLLPAIGLICSVFQALSSVWSPKVSVIYSFVVPVLVAIFMRRSSLISVSYLMLALVLEAPILFSAGMAKADFISHSVIAAVTVIIARSRMGKDLDAFLATHESLASKEALINYQMEMNDQIRAFLPNEIYRRLMGYSQKTGNTLIAAMDHLLKPREADVACLYSDIRNFTKAANRMDGALLKTVLPQLKASTDAVEMHGGIPLNVGDLIFSYFDQDDEKERVFRALTCAFDMVSLNQVINQGVAVEETVKRFVIASSGRAIIGNIGGTVSARLITALGRPVNLLARIDELTKVPRFAERIPKDSVIATAEFLALVCKYIPEFDYTLVTLKDLGLTVRNFAEVETIVLMPVHAHNSALIHLACSGEDHDELTLKRKRA